MFSFDSEHSLLKRQDLHLLPEEQTALSIEHIFLNYGEKSILKDINLRIAKKKVTAFIGPSGCGKSTLLQCFNRMTDLVENCHIKGKVILNQQNIFDPKVDVAQLRRQVGMVFQRPNPFPKTIYENVVYGLRLQGIKQRRILDEKVEEALKGAALWGEVKDRLHEHAFSLSGGQQQRLVIARAIAIEPEILLLDEPTSALDPISTFTIEQLIHELKQKYTVIMVTHNMQQAARVSDHTAFLYMGELVEYATTDDLFTTPMQKQTEDYITGRYG
jgi:phosphate transport system ATP-binding protein